MTDGGAVTTSEPSPDEWSGLVGQSFVADKLMPNITLNRSAHQRRFARCWVPAPG
jgi:hypothetical protein